MNGIPHRPVLETKSDPHWFYRNIYRFFTPVFPTLENFLIDKLSDASLSYFQGLLAFDQVADNPCSDQLMEQLRTGFVLHEKAVKELASDQSYNRVQFLPRT
jgi:hypothetical protein